MSTKQRFLAVSHEATATGAPIFFHTLLNWLKINHPEIEMDVVVIKDGVLRKKFQSLGPHLFLCDLPSETQSHALNAFMAGKQYNTIYLNTLETAHILSALIKTGVIQSSTQVISNIHELEGTIQMYGPQRIQIINERADVIIASSAVVKENLVHNHHFDANKVTIINPCSRDLVPQDFLPEDQVRIAALKGKKIILGCGEVSVGKGVDVFLKTAQQLKEKYEQQKKPIDFHFIWLGPDLRKIAAYYERDIDILKMHDVMSMVPHRDEVYPFFNRADLFFMCSRQESFGLVCLEACSLKKPILYFPDAGGIKDFLGSERGFPLPYLDVEAAVSEIEKLFSNPERGKVAAGKAYEGWKNEFSAAQVCQKVFQLMNGHS